MRRKAIPLLLVASLAVLVASILLTTKPSAPSKADAADIPSHGASPADETLTAPDVRPASMGPVLAEGTPAVPAPPVVTAAAPVPARTAAEALPETPADKDALVSAVEKTLAEAGLAGAGITVSVSGGVPASVAGPVGSVPVDTQPVPATRELSIPVPTGAKAPVVFYDETPRPLPQQRALDKIATEFSETVANPPAGYSAQEVWEAARKVADERYALLYGFDAFNQLSMQAAKEALKEKKAAAAAMPGTP